MVFQILDTNIQQALERLNIHQPTTIQQMAIPHILEGKDILATSLTGSGKTLAYVLPVVQNILPHMTGSTSPANHFLRVLILLPTRELALQVFSTVENICKNTNVRAVCLLGGKNMREQKQALLKGADIVVATIGRLHDHILSRNLHANNLETLVIDEADKMMDMGFLPDLERLCQQHLPKNRQTLLFSATFSSEIRRIANTYLQNPLKIEATPSNTAQSTITQKMYLVKTHQRFAMLMHILEQNPEQAIVFVNSKLDCKRLMASLENEGINVRTIHGDLHQDDRIKVMESFRNKKTRILVATDVAARGLDVPKLPLVVNYRLPFHAQDYVHRIGRTGRAGEPGLAISLFDDKTDASEFAAIQKFLGKKIELESVGALAEYTQQSMQQHHTRRLATEHKDRRRYNQDARPRQEPSSRNVPSARPHFDYDGVDWPSNLPPTSKAKVRNTNNSAYNHAPHGQNYGPSHGRRADVGKKENGKKSGPNCALLVKR